jgi:type VI secretion system protein ImpB
MARESSQKFIKRNRAPRVHIEYEVDTGDATELKELPFVMGVMADLSGRPAEPLPGMADRKFTKVDVDNFDDFLKANKPRVAFEVPNTLTGKGNLKVEMTFESLDDFSPAAVARKVEGLKQLFEARTELSNLLTKMDGKPKAEKLMSDLLSQPALIKQLATETTPDNQPKE